MFVVLLMTISCDRKTLEPTTPNPDVLIGMYRLREFSPGFRPMES